jgi:carboxylesterase
MTPLLSNPTRTFDDALSRIAQLRAADDDTIHPYSQTKFWSHQTKTPRAILYLHGYTDSTHQFQALGDLLFAQGYNVLAPRMPYHGYQDRMSRAHGKFTAAEMLDWANNATDVALGLGDKLTVIGLSLGGVLATWVAEHRCDVDCVLIVSPAYGTGMIPPRMTTPAAHLLRRLPNMFMWWDPRIREQAGFEYTYPRFATRTLAHAFLLGADLLKQARQKPPAARAVWMITNGNDFAISNTICAAFVSAWRTHNPNQIHTYQFPRALGIPHDIMDPADPLVKPDAVFPRLLEIVKNGIPLEPNPNPYQGEPHEQSS